MKKYLRPIATTLAAMLAVAGVTALDLPVKKINGKDYYYYAVKRGDTVLSIARRLGVTRDDIVNYNPSAADVLRQGATLYLPVSEFKDVISPETSAAGGEDGRADAPFFYKVQRGETLFGISHRFGVSPDEIVALNPGSNAGIKAGQSLRIPAGARIAAETAVAAETPAAETPAAAPAVAVNPSPVMVPEENLDRGLRPVEPETVMEEGQTDTLRPAVGVLLPLSLHGDAQSKHARTATEFIKGFMMGLKAEGDNAWPMDLYVFDNAGRTDTVASILDGDGCPDLSLLITPDAQPTVTAALEALGDRDTYLLNLLAAQDTAYLTDSRVMQFNVPHDIMYAKAAEALTMTFDGYTPVFLISKGGRSEKVPFTDYMRQLYAESGIATIDLTYEGMLSQRELEGFDPAGRYVFIPGSGSLTEFNKFARALIALRSSAADPSAIGVFGYPDWTTFRNDALDCLHQLGAVIYSRFYDDASSAEVKAFAEAFERQYGAPMLEQVPSQALLGYDTARYVMANLRAGRGNFDPEWNVPFHGLQSTFMFIDAEGRAAVDGTANQALYIITFLPGNEVAVRVF